MKKMGFMFVLCFQLVCGNGLFSEEVYADFIRFKTQLYNAADTEAAAVIRDYTVTVEEAVLTEEEKLTLSNLLVLERLVFEQSRSKEPENTVHRQLADQNAACERFMADKKTSAVSKWFLMSWGDIKSRLTSFISGKELYAEANKARQLYAAALKKDKKFSQGHLSLGLWLFFAPPIAGGGYDAALKSFSNAVSYAASPHEKYLALLYRSQVYIALEQPKKAAADLKAAHRLIPEETFTETVRTKNETGTLFFE